jgi:hypothetical protein
MTEIWTFSLGVGLTVAITIAVLWYLQPHLRTLLAELCGTDERARFWTSFSNVTLFLTPLIFALRMQPAKESVRPLVYEMSDQVSVALLGLVIAIGIVGIVIGRFIPRPLVVAATSRKLAGEQ